METRKRIIRVSAFLVWTVLIAAVSFQAGKRWMQNRGADFIINTQTFYATILEIRENSLLVEGLEENDINYRGQFSLHLDDETEFTWRYTEISLEDLDAGDRISVTFSGGVAESYPAQIGDTEVVQLLEDEL